MSLLVVVAIFSLLHVAVNAAVNWTAMPFNPPSVPLAVRSPYLNTWLAQGTGAQLNDGWPTFWTGAIVGWAGYVKVDGTTYTFLGVPGNSGTQKAVQKNLTWTSTESTFLMTAGGIDLTANFLSPVNPTHLVNQSLPFSYLAVSVASNDGNSHSVQVYSDISAEWITSNDSLVANWNTTTGDVLIHEVQLANESVFAELSDRAQYGSAYYSTLNANGVTYQTGEDTTVRGQFIANGTLLNTQDTEFRAVSDRWPVFGFAHDLGTVKDATGPILFSVGHVRDPAVEYIVAGNALQNRSLYFWSQYPTVDAAITDFMADYDNALSVAKAFDSQVQSDASKVSSSYADIVALSIRQALATVELTISKDGDGSWNTSDVMMFLKEISSDGDVNTVDVISPAWPLFLYTNPALGKYLLLPLFEYQASGQYPNQWSVHDLGAHYPQATGHNDGKDEAMPVEECGNMLIMTLSYTQATGDQSLIKTYYNLLDQWTQFLIADSLIPADQLSTDNFAGSLANQTNLAVKGIIGIKAMSSIANMTGDASRASNYSSIASSYAQQFLQLATSSSGHHLTLAYGNDSSWGLAYNLYADKLLNTQVFSESLYQMQDSWYSNVANTYGVPLDTRHTYTESNWEIWTAATATTSHTRALLIDAVHAYASSGLSSVPFGDWYDTVSGKTQAFQARPEVGGHLALLVVNASVSASASSSSSSVASQATGASGSPAASSTGASRSGSARALSWDGRLVLAHAVLLMLVTVGLGWVIAV
ncbi:DUF1793-domain-containing protein [Heliocybe sulcata]|uniref:DUF1793-domain-containing protein n=1 Tax=Heliocybe sulcata TaxID=5364 RepID=A0A5C3MVD0_9AGAM|nr:DUF1793-domain-containing protein [Heliocybe sulcata]